MPKPSLVLLREPRNPSVSSAAPGATYGVSLRGLRSPLAPSLRSGAAGLRRRLGKPALPMANARAALVFPRDPRSPAASLGLPPRPAAVSAGILLLFPQNREPALPYVIPAKAGIQGLRIDSVYPACKVDESGPTCHSRTRLRGHRLRRESGRSVLLPSVIPAKAGIQALRIVPLSFPGSREPGNNTTERSISKLLDSHGCRFGESEPQANGKKFRISKLHPCRDFSVAPFGRSIKIEPYFNVYSRRNKIENQCSIVRYSLFEGGL